MDDLDGIPVVIVLAMPNDTNEHVFTLDTDNYPVVGGTTPELANKTIKVSSVILFINDGADIMEYMKIDGELISSIPYTQAIPAAGNYQTLNALAVFGKPYIPMRSTFTYKKVGSNSANGIIYVHGIAVDRNV